MVQRCSDARTGPFLVRPPTVQKVQSGFQSVSDLLSWSNLVALLAGISSRNKCATSLTILGLNFHPFGSKNERIRKRYYMHSLAVFLHAMTPVLWLFECSNYAMHLYVWGPEVDPEAMLLRWHGHPEGIRGWAQPLLWNQASECQKLHPFEWAVHLPSISINFYFDLNLLAYSKFSDCSCLTRCIIESLAFFLDRGKGCANAGTWPGDQA